MQVKFCALPKSVSFYGAVSSTRMKKQSQQMGELALIERIRRDAGSSRSPFVTLGIGDDCAILRPPTGSEVLVTTDFTLEGRHFRRDWHSPESAGHRCLARGLSDLAAMGATPMAAFLSLALPMGVNQGWVDRFFAGLQALAKRQKVSLAGGDTAAAPGEQILADIVLVGTAPAGQALRRSGAHVGDVLYVTGTLGGAPAELDRMQSGRVRRVETGTPEVHPQMFPEPRIAVGERLLKRRMATACMDLSDGLSTDLAHLCRESRVGAEIEEARLPVHRLATLSQALHGGEDYELLFTAPAPIRMPKRIAGVAVTAIGRVTRAKAGVVLVQADGVRKPLQAGGWEHFKS
jgi:thiamine-monophosphate kinase